jgi:NAD(P)-dependent dehydrogenase (short-subunit alcohol dehydrogenase family)
MILKDKVVAVAGAGPGLGREIAEVALRDGARVVVGARKEGKLEALARDLDPSGERVAWAQLDITDMARCEAFTSTAVERFGGLDAVVQVAAFDSVFGTIETQTSEDWLRTLEANVVGTTQVVRAATPHLRARGGGAIVLIGSQAMWLPPKMHQIAYGASKGAILAAMRHMVEELGPDKIRVNMVIPTWMWGPPVELYVKWQSKERGISEQEIIDEITANMPLGEIPADEDVAEVVGFFCSDRARMVTGETLLVNAGEIVR